MRPLRLSCLLLCGLSLSAAAPAGLQGQATREEQIRAIVEQQLDPQLLRWDSLFAERGYRRLAEAGQVGASNAGETAELSTDLRAGTRYALVAVCDNDCADLDLALLGPDGSDLGQDVETDSQPVVLHTAAATGRYTVRVVTVTCSAEPCWYSFAVYADASATAVEEGQERILVDEAGTLRAGDARLNSGEFVDRFEVEVDVGQTLVVDVRSSEFDTYAYVRSPSGEQTDNDDFEGDASHSHVEIQVQEAGTWVVAATSFEPKETGAYRIRVATRAGTLAAAGSGPRIESGSLEEGDRQLESGEYYDSFAVQGEAGELLVLDLRSEDLDPYLMLIAPSRETVQNDDFEGDAHRSVISQTLTESGEYQVAVTSYAKGETGRYTLRIQHGASTAEGPRTERGTLQEGDEQLQSGEFADVYTVQGTPGQRLLATVSSSDFDTYLIVRGPSQDRAENDDLEGRPGESEVDLTLTETGEYRVVVTSYATGETGSYELRLQQSVLEESTQAQRDVEQLSVGSSVRGTLAEGDGTLEGGEYRDLFVFEGQSGQAISVELSSTEFDTYVGLITPSGENIDNDDWEGSTSRSRVDLVLPEDGRYRIFATSYQAGEVGSYELALSQGAATAANTASATDAPQRIYGVFVGISDYGGRANDLAYTADDARTVARALQTGGGMRAEDAVILTDREATRANVEAAVRQVGQRAGPQDLFVFFYSGHGARVRRDGPQSTDPDALDETLEFFDRGITDDEFSALLGEIQPGVSMLVLDACFSGGFSKDVISVPGRIGFFSSEEDVTSSVAAKFRAGGYLAHFVGDAVGDRLADADGDNAVSAIELSQYLYERYRTDVKSGNPDDYVRTGGPQTGYQHLVVDRGSIPPDRILFR